MIFVERFWRRPAWGGEPAYEARTHVRMKSLAAAPGAKHFILNS
jgi:hypothetical protein